MSKTRAKTRAQGIRVMLASSLTMVIALTVTVAANGAPNSQTLTPEQSARKKSEYLRYERYVQAQLTKQDQSLRQQKLQQLAKRTAASKSDEPKTPHKHVPIQRQDILLVMPAKGAKAADIKETIENAQGEICGKLGAGGLRVILVKAQPGKVVQLQRALAVDTRNFKHVDFNRPMEPSWIPTTEPTYSKSWHLMRMRIPDAWDLIERTNHFPMPVAIFDTGVEGPESWLSGPGADATASAGTERLDDDVDLDEDMDIEDQEDEIVRVGNEIKTLTYGCTDPIGHGTAVASVINGRSFNGVASAGVNSRVPIISIRIGAGPKGATDELAMVKAMCVMYDTSNVPIINISYSTAAYKSENPVLHEFFKDWYYRKNGLIFIAAGNKGENLSEKNEPYIIVVSAMAHSGLMKQVKIPGMKSAYGTSVDFTAPGQDIEISKPNGTPDSLDGSSLSAPLVAGIASVILTINPKLKNTQVEQILRDSCENPSNKDWTPEFGYGMPDALKAAQAAEKTLQ
jgi:NACalpha-BTF3-like transcription factor